MPEYRLPVGGSQDSPPLRHEQEVGLKAPAIPGLGQRFAACVRSH